MKVFMSRIFDRYRFHEEVYALELYPETNFEREVLEAFVSIYRAGTHWDTVYKIYRHDIDLWGYIIYFPLSVAEENRKELPDDLKLPELKPSSKREVVRNE